LQRTSQLATFGPDPGVLQFARTGAELHDYINRTVAAQVFGKLARVPGGCGCREQKRGNKKSR
jgi:hypothetical protein